MEPLEHPDRPQVVDLTYASDDPARPAEPSDPFGTTTGAPPSAAPAGPADDDELAILARIEQDLAAVEEAMAGLDRIDADQLGGAAAAAQVAAIAGSDRFAVPD